MCALNSAMKAFAEDRLLDCAGTELDRCSALTLTVVPVTVTVPLSSRVTDTRALDLDLAPCVVERDLCRPVVRIRTTSLPGVVEQRLVPAGGEIRIASPPELSSSSTSWPCLVRISFWSLAGGALAGWLVHAVVEPAEHDREAHVAVHERDEHLVALLRDEVRAVPVAGVQLGHPAPVADLLTRRRTTGSAA